METEKLIKLYYTEVIDIQHSHLRMLLTIQGLSIQLHSLYTIPLNYYNRLSLRNVVSYEASFNSAKIVSQIYSLNIFKLYCKKCID